VKWMDFGIRMFAALFLGGVIGLERQWRQRMTGLRTNGLVAVGSAMFIMMGGLISGDGRQGRVAAYVVSGIGFLGGGWRTWPRECNEVCFDGPVFRTGDPPMGHNILINHKEREHDAVLQLARDIVEAGERRGRPLSPGEDAMVTEFVKQAQALEHEISLLRRDQRRAIPSKHRETEDA
jgi:hypothetical protein